MTDDPLDLSPLDPTGDSARHERALRAIGDRAAPLLAARRAPANVLAVLPRWRLPIVLAAGIAAILTLAVVNRSSTTAAASLTLAEGLGVPTTLAGSLDQNTLPDPGDLFSLTERR